MPKGIYARKPRLNNKYAVGTRHKCGEDTVVILENLPRVPGRNRRVVVRFEESGYVANVQASNIAPGKVRDPRKRTVYGVGYLDMDIKIPRRGDGFIRRVYDLWANMLRRCYTDYKGCYVGVTVDPRWHSFRAFLNSLEDVPGFPEFERGENVHLDKDTRVPGSKVYSVDTCAFIPAFENIRDGALRRWGRD